MRMRFFTHRNYVIKVRRNDINFCSSKLHRTKYVETRSMFYSSRLHRTKHVEMTLITSPSKLRRRKYIKTTSIFCHRNYIKQKTSNDIEFLPIEITSKKVCRNDINFSPIEITSNKERRNDFDFSPIRIILKKYAEMTWKFVNFFSWMYRHNIAIELTLIQHGVSIEKLMRDDYTTGCLLDYNYFKNYYKVIVIDLGKTQALYVDPKAIQLINFTGSLTQQATIFFIIEEAKEAVLDFSHGTVKVF